jgi:hypothetical protein
VTPLREGGSMPGLVEADDDGLYVLKVHGAAQGPGTGCRQGQVATARRSRWRCPIPVAILPSGRFLVLSREELRE